MLSVPLKRRPSSSRDGEFFMPNRLAALSDAELEEHEEKVDEYLQKQAQVRQIIYETVSEGGGLRSCASSRNLRRSKC
jgi:hypothetical protein